MSHNHKVDLVLSPAPGNSKIVIDGHDISGMTRSVSVRADCDSTTKLVIESSFAHVHVLAEMLSIELSGDVYLVGPTSDRKCFADYNEAQQQCEKGHVPETVRFVGRTQQRGAA